MGQKGSSYRLIKVLRENRAAQGFFLMSPTNIYLFVFIVLPLLLVVGLSFLSRGIYGEVVVRINLTNYLRLFDPLYARILVYSLAVGFGTTLISLLIGYPMAYYIARAPARNRSLLLFLILIPFWTNFIIRIYAWIMILRTEGFLNSFLQWTGIIQQPLNILYTPTAVLIGMVYEFLPFMVLPLYTSLEKIKEAQLEAAADLGAPPWMAFLRVTLPLSVPGMIAGTILVFIPAMGMFVVPDLLGGAKTILIGNVIRNQFLTARDWPFGAAASMLLMLLTMAFTLYYTCKAGFGEGVIGMSEKKPALWLSIYTFLVYAYIYLPILILIIFSFNTQRLNIHWEGFTLGWYDKLFHDSQVMLATRNTLIIAIVSTIIATVIGTMAALALQRYRFLGYSLSETVLYIPVVIPEVVMGISLLVFFAMMKFTLGLVTITLCHIAFNIPFVTLVVRARLHGFDKTIEEASMDLGANEMVTFWRVTLPTIFPGVLSGAMLAFTLSLDDYVITYFTAGPGSTTLPLRIFSMVRFAVTPEVNALSTIWILIVFILLFIAEYAPRRRTKNQI